jgi:hypothetical protein
VSCVRSYSYIHYIRNLLERLNLAAYVIYDSCAVAVDENIVILSTAFYELFNPLNF